MPNAIVITKQSLAVKLGLRGHTSKDGKKHTTNDRDEVRCGLLTGDSKAI